MKPRHQVSKDAIELIKRFEGYRRASAQLPDGGYTIGYGHTKTARAGVEIDERDAEALLRYDLLAVTGAVNDLTFTPLTQNQFDALVCFAFNIGVENFRRSSVLRRVNEGNLLQAAAAIEIWRKSEFEGEKIVIDALIRRRAAEKSLFLLPPAGYVPAPSPVLPPKVDYDVVGAGPKEKPVRMVVALDGVTAEAVPEPVEDGLTEFVAVQPDASPITIAAEVVAAKLQSIAPDEIEVEDTSEDVEELADVEVEASEPSESVEDEPAGEDAVVEDAEPEQPEGAVQEEVPEDAVIEDAIIEGAAEDAAPVEDITRDATAAEPVEVEAELVEQDAVEAENSPAQPAAPLMDFTLTPPPLDLHIAEPVDAPEAVVEPESEPLPFDAPTADEMLAPPPPSRSQPLVAQDERTVLYQGGPVGPVRGGDFPAFDTDTVKPMNFNLAPLFALGVVGLVAFAFAIVWGLSTTNSSGGLLGPQLVSWVVGSVGIACVVAAFYLLVSRLGGSED